MTRCEAANLNRAPGTGRDALLAKIAFLVGGTLLPATRHLPVAVV